MIDLKNYTKSFKLIYRLCPRWVQWVHRDLVDRRREGSCYYPMAEVGLLGLCLFLFRYPSLRFFVKEFRGNALGLDNLNQFFTVGGVPSDDEFRYILSQVSTRSLNQILKRIHQRLERKKLVQSWRLLGKYDLVSLDGSGQLSSYKVQCPKCLTRKGPKEETLYLHGQLVASLISATQPLSLTMAYEPIENSDDNRIYEKNDCELNAAKRLLKRLNSSYPKRPLCLTGDNLFATKYFVRNVSDNGWSFIITAKPERNKELFSWYDYLHERKQTLHYTDKEGHGHHYEWSHQLPIKQENRDRDHFYVNLIEYTELGTDGQILDYNTWLTNIDLHEGNVKDIAKGGRARFTIENVTFNEKKTRGFHTEHNFGHSGNLPNVFFGLAQIAHLFSQLFSLWREGRRLIKTIGSGRRYWERAATLFSSVPMPVDEVPILNLKFTIDSS